MVYVPLVSDSSARAVVRTRSLSDIQYIGCHLDEIGLETGSGRAAGGVHRFAVAVEHRIAGILVGGGLGIVQRLKRSLLALAINPRLTHSVQSVSSPCGGLCSRRGINPQCRQAAV